MKLDKLIDVIKDILDKKDMDKSKIKQIWIVKNIKNDEKDNIILISFSKAQNTNNEDKEQDSKYNILIKIPEEISKQININKFKQQIKETIPVENVKKDINNGTRQENRKKINVNKESAEKLIKLLDKIKQQNQKTNNKIYQQALVSEFSIDKQKAIKEVVSYLAQVEKKEWSQLKQDIKDLIQNSPNKENDLVEILNKIEVKGKNRKTITKLISEINKFTDEDIKNIVNKKDIFISEDKQQGENKNKVNHKRIINNSLGIREAKDNSNLLKTKKTTDLKLSKKQINLKTNFINFKEVVPLKTKDNIKDKIIFNNLEIEFKDFEKSSNDKVKNIKIFPERSTFQNKDDLTGYKNIANKKKPNTQYSNKRFAKTLKQSNVMEQIKEKINIKSFKNKNQLEIKLKPDSLGKLKINLSVESNKITGKILVENKLVQSYLENNLHELKNNLLSKGLQFDQFSIENENKEFNTNQESNSNNFFQQFKDGDKRRRDQSQNSVYEFPQNSNLKNRTIEQTIQNNHKKTYLNHRGFEYFA
mgnify:FL=1